MKGIWYSLIITGLIASVGCAGRRADVVIDPAGVDMGLYQKDLAECQEIAKQVNPKAVGGAVGGAVVGGAVGGIVGNTRTAEKGAGIGAVTGVARGAAATARGASSFGGGGQATQCTSFLVAARRTPFEGASPRKGVAPPRGKRNSSSSKTA